ncbi:MAG: Clp protease [Actinobacteria bacterium]|nr:MAG: Clp protease [Actinomycetota bacterium]
MARNDPVRAAAILRRAREEAKAAGSASVEAEHALLAIAAHKGTEAQRILASAGLDHATILEALDREFEESLAGAGVSLSAFGLPPASPRNEGIPRWGTSFKLAVHRAPKSGPGERLDATRLLLGILRAQVGIVPRALSLAGVDRAGLAATAEQALTPRGAPQGAG